MFYDMHLHSTFSADGKSTLDEYAALRDGGTGTVSCSPAGYAICPPVPHLGFAEHIDFLPECGSFEYMDPDEYISAVCSFRERGFDFYAGAEIDYVKQVEADISVHLKQYSYDYTICSVHMVNGLSISDRNFPPEGTDAGYLLGVAADYYRELEYGIKAEMFDVLGHVGVFVRYLPREVLGDRRLSNFIREAELEIAKLCAASGMIVEVNTSGLFSPYAGLLPGVEFFKNYHAFGGRLVCTGSDAHRAADAARGFGEAAGALKAAGFEYITLPWNREKLVNL